MHRTGGRESARSSWPKPTASARRLVMGLLYIVVLEISLSPNVQGLKSISVREFVMTIAKKPAAGSPGITASSVPVDTVYMMSAFFLIVGLGLGIRWLSRYEMAERI